MYRMEEGGKYKCSISSEDQVQIALDAAVGWS